MIVKHKCGQAPSNKFGKAGFDAEKQMAYKLAAVFEHADDVFVFNDIRIMHQGYPAQIDHLVLHRFGFFLIESKSVSSQIEVNKKLEFVRIYNGKRQGMDSPISQVKRQSERLSSLLNDNKEQLRRKVLFGLAQGHFGDERFEQLVAISGSGEIIRKGCDPPELMKADAVVDRIRERVERRQSLTGVKGVLKHALAGNAESKGMEKDHLTELTDEELTRIRDFLIANHQPLKIPVEQKPSLTPEPVAARLESPAPELPLPHPTTPTKDHACRECKSVNIKVVKGRYNYYFKCSDCGGNTPIDHTCRCGQRAKISKRGNRFSWKCDCGNDDLFFENAAS